eukprot:m.351500 g.351500  ORF g.351500 m.351500 type:complete len:56 (+) comp16260_c0_seq1:69-236(+)
MPVYATGFSLMVTLHTTSQANKANQTTPPITKQTVFSGIYTKFSGLTHPSATGFC